MFKGDLEGDLEEDSEGNLKGDLEVDLDGLFVKCQAQVHFWSGLFTAQI